MADDPLDAIRRAVASGEFHKALLLWNEYANRLGSELRSGPVARSRLAETRELVNWARQVTLAARAHAQARLRGIQVAAEYGITSPHRASRIRASF